MALPYLEKSNWPSNKEPGERVVNPSSDAKLQDHLIQELLVSLEHKDQAKAREALIALIYSIHEEDFSESETS